MTKKKKQMFFDDTLDAYEKEIEEGLPNTKKDLIQTDNLKEEAALAKAAAANYLRKNSKINIRLTSFDLEGIRRLASREGLPYQTFISSILHKYVTSHL